MVTDHNRRLPMPFWKVQRAARANVTDGSAARETTPNIEPIQVFTAERHLEGWVVATQERMTDVLNARESIRICVDATADTWETIDRDEILLVAPPEQATDPQRRIHRRKHRLVVSVGPYIVTGTVHLQAGIALDPYLLRTRQHFLPMTDALVSSRLDPTFAQDLPVVIVNVRNLVEIRSQLSVV
jgi:hypothetical protein